MTRRKHETVVEREQRRQFEAACYMLFQRGEDTCAIAQRWLGVSEAQVQRALVRARALRGPYRGRAGPVKPPCGYGRPA
jgi:DNA-binding transcriptional regulator LsrR (DeoR family)